jgi:hypothetical protein
MAYRFHVRWHPVGVVVSKAPYQQGELLIAGEGYCGIPFEELVKVASKSGVVDVPDSAAANSSLQGELCR